MIIKVDADGKATIEQLCDIALRTNGLKSMEAIKAILDSVQLIEE
jgi:hypothetical protein